MVSDILKIKTSIPPLGAHILSRPQLLEGMEKYLMSPEGFTRPLTLISSPAGFGKTTLARTWLSSRENMAAWLSLEEEDNERERFWIYLITALQNISPRVGEGVLKMLKPRGVLSESSLSRESFLTPLLNQLLALEEPLLLVLDDYHLINNTQIHRDMIFFVENLPPTLHLVVTTRSDPPWPLGKWRARGKMSEIRLGELKFSREEAGCLMEKIKGIHLTGEQLDTLYKKTEGWVTGLQLAAFPLATTPDPGEFIKNFAGSHRHLLHFLSEEVFNRQPGKVQEFLLETSLLDRFCASLCDFVTGSGESSKILAYLEGENLFVIPLDDQGTWYRYHHMFSDLLLYYLKQRKPEKIDQLHDRAIEWFLKEGELGEAVRQALSGNKLEKAGQILHEHYEEILQREGPRLLLKCLFKFPRELFRKYPLLAAHKALFLLARKGREEAREYLELAERQSYPDQEEQKKYEGLLAAIKSYYHINSHNFPQAMEEAEKALNLLPPQSHYWRMGIALFYGDARLFSGNPKEAYPHYLEAHQNSKRLGYRYLSLVTGFKLATTLYHLGRLKEARELTQKKLETASKEGLAQLHVVGTFWTLQGELMREEGRLEEAEPCIERGLFLSELQKPPYGWNCLFKVALLFSQGKYYEALEVIYEIEALNQEVELPLFITTTAAAWEARLYLELGDTSRAREGLARFNVLEDNPLQGGREKGYLVLSRLLLAEGEKIKEGKRKTGKSKEKFSLALKILNQIEDMAARGENRGVLLETLLIKAWVKERAGKMEGAEKCLLSALEKGKEGDYFQLFLDEGKKLAALFPRIIKKIKRDSLSPGRENMWEYAQDIYSHISPAEKSEEKIRSGRKTKGRKEEEPEASPPQGLVEELSRRELEVLELISQGLSNQDISQKLFLSEGTVKWHTTNIYGKLGVRGRTQAVALARKLKLIS